MKVCAVCKIEKPPEAFSLGGRPTKKRTSCCKQCNSLRTKAYTDSNKEKVAERRRQWYKNNRPLALSRAEQFRQQNTGYSRHKKTGFSPELFELSKKVQRQQCAICSVDFSTLKSQRVHADHCHSSGALRGVLCHKCNLGLGYFKDSVEILTSAIEYLRNPPLSLA